MLPGLFSPIPEAARAEIMTENKGRPIVTLRGIEKQYGIKKVIDGLDLEILQGEFISIFGPNGAGKTTLLRLLAGLLEPGSGRIEGAPGVLDRAGLGYISHQVMLYPDLTGCENLEFFARLHGLPDPCGSAWRMIRRTGLEQDADRPVRGYSRGMMQRLSLGRFLLNDPGLLLLDEPFTGLDRVGARFLSGVLEEARGTGKTVLMVTHDLEKGYEMADRLVVLSRGRILLDAAAADLSFTEFASCYDGEANR